MEIIRGKQTSFIGAETLAECIENYSSVHMDLGTGDGRYIIQRAQQHPLRFFIGIDACRENLRKSSVRTPANAMFVIANARALPAELHGLVAEITVNFPWGNLLTGLLASDSAVMENLQSVLQPGANLAMHLNAGALNEAGWSLEGGTLQIQAVLQSTGFYIRPPASMGTYQLRDFPTTWAKRLAYGRDPRAMQLSGVKERILDNPI